jgi:hypothetical protein
MYALAVTTTVGGIGPVGVVVGRIGSFPPQAAIITVVNPVIARRTFRGVGMPLTPSQPP